MSDIIEFRRDENSVDAVRTDADLVEITIYNHTSEICFDDKKIYLIAG